MRNIETNHMVQVEHFGVLTKIIIVYLGKVVQIIFANEKSHLKELKHKKGNSVLKNKINKVVMENILN